MVPRSRKLTAEQIGDLTIAGHRWKARLLRTQAFVAAMLPTGRRALGASVPPHPSPVWKRWHRPSTNCGWRGLRSTERRPLDRATATNACVRSDGPVQRSPTVVRRRPGPRREVESRVGPSVSFSVPLCLCGSAVGWVAFAFLASWRFKIWAGGFSDFVQPLAWEVGMWRTSPG